MTLKPEGKKYFSDTQLSIINLVTSVTIRNSAMRQNNINIRVSLLSSAAYTVIFSKQFKLDLVACSKLISITSMNHTCLQTASKNIIVPVVANLKNIM